MPIVADCGVSYKDNVFEYFPKNAVTCPHCQKPMRLRDHTMRIMRTSGGNKDYVRIPRFQCDEETCSVKIMRVLPTDLTPHKHYTTPTIEDALDDNLDEKETYTEDGALSPSPKTVSCWNKWISKNETLIDAFLRSSAFRLLGYGIELLKSTASILKELRSSSPGWLCLIQKLIYCSGLWLIP